MKEALRRNPNMKLYGLPWNWPGWIATDANNTQGQFAQCTNASVPAAQKGQWCSTGGKCIPSPDDNYPGHGDGNMAPCDPFSDNARTASYVTSWVACAKHSHNLTINWIGIWNESPWNPDYILELRAQLDAVGLQATKIIGGDGNIIGLAQALQQNASVAHAVEALGRHYPGFEGNDPANRIPSELGIPLWASEDYSTYSDANGAGCWARSLVLNAANNYTATISWYLLGAFSRGIIYDSDGFIRAEWPKSGHWEPTPMLWMTLHWSRFVSGGAAQFIGTGELLEGGKFAALQSDDGAVTVIVEAMTWNSSLCIRSNPPYYTVASTQNASLRFQELASKKTKRLAVYRSCTGWRYGGDGDQSPSYFQQVSDAHVSDDGTMLLEDVRADCVYTATTRTTLLGAPAKPVLPARPPPAAFLLPHTDNFDGARSDGNEALYFSDVLGKYELGLAAGGRSGQTLQQAVTEYLPISGNCPAHFYPMSLIGDMYAADANISVDIYLPKASAAGFVAHRTREWHSAQADGAFRTRVPGLFLWLGPAAGVGRSHWRVCTDNNCTGAGVVLASGTAAAAVSSWHRVSLAVNGSVATASLDGVVLCSNVKLPPSAPDKQTAHSESPSINFPTGHAAGSGEELETHV
jgi:galactosylceramidase